ncbi:MAG TPA: heparinase II/III family protein [Acidobacteriota bacterium]|nr:heparinase II/III family protein [Acidobacteriota bacterium]
MKRSTVRTMVTCLTVSVLTFLFLTAQTDQLKDFDRLPDHPRLLLLNGEEAAIRKAIASEGIWRQIHERILIESEALLETAPVERVVVGRRLLAKSRECLRRVFLLSYSWRMTGEEKFAKRAEQELLAVSRFIDWNPSHFLDVAEMTMAAAIGYDWLYRVLPAETRLIVKEAIIQKGLEPSLESRYSGWLQSSHNWNQVCNAGMTYGALAIFEDRPDLARQIIKRSIDSIPLAMKDYGPDGAYPEGYGYWGYGTNFNVMFLSALQKAFGHDFGLSGAPGFMRTAGYLQHMTGPSGLCFNYSDSGAQPGLNPAMFWFARQLNDFSLLWLEKGYLENERTSRDRLLPATLIWGGSGEAVTISPPEKNVWVGRGKNPVALMRTSWTDPTAIFVGVKAGSPSVNHGHMDIGSFVMEADGVRWAMDFGAQDYHSLESKGVDLWNRDQDSQRWQVFRYNNFVHNTLTIDGQLQRVAGFGPITRHSDNPRFMHAQVDITDVYKGQIKKADRGVAIVDGRYVVVRDELETLGKETAVRWTLLTPAEVKITGPDSAELSLKGQHLRLQVKGSQGIMMKTWSTDPPYDYDAPNPGTVMVGFETVLPANSRETLAVFLVPKRVDEGAIKDPGPLTSWPSQE